MMKPKNDGSERDPEIEHIFNTVMELHERIAKIRPNLIVSVQFGDKLKYGGNGKVGMGDFEDATPDFRDFENAVPPPSDFRDFANAPSEPFRSSFDKVGDGFINVHGLDLKSGFQVLPGVSLKDLKTDVKQERK